MKKSMQELLNEIFENESFEQLKKEWDEIASHKVNSPNAYQSIAKMREFRVEFYDIELAQIPPNIETSKIEKAPIEFGAFFYKKQFVYSHNE